MGKRIIVAGAALALLGALLAATWTIFDWPPPLLILKYGFPPTGGPTGRRRTVEGIEFIELKPGYFRMGSHDICLEGDLLGRICEPLGIAWGEHARHGHECPTRWVEIPRRIWIGRTEVTNEQYERFDPEHERTRLSTGDGHPVVRISWEDAKRYCGWLAERAGLPVRLPSEAEWEWSCRAGSGRSFCYGDEEGDLGSYAWFDANAKGEAREVATRWANAWGLHDLHGNVWEWCEDTYHATYEGAPADGSAWTEGGEEWEEGTPSRILRGGSWDFQAEHCRSAFRCRYFPGIRNLGFRPAFTFADDEQDGQPETKDRDE